MASRVIQGFFIGGYATALQSAQRSGLSVTVPGVLQRRPVPGVLPAGDESLGIDPIRLGLTHGGGQPLPRAVLAKMEKAFNADFSAVRIHQGPQAARIGAVAFTTGNDIYFAPGRFLPDMPQGQQLLGHELAHVLQQRQGRVRTSSMGVAVVYDQQLEAEANRLGARAAAFQIMPSGTGEQTMQCRGLTVPPVGGMPPLQAFMGHNRKRWTDAQREQSRKFWEKKTARMTRQRDAEEARQRHDEEAETLRTLRIEPSKIIPADEEYFAQYLKTRSKTMIEVYRGDGRDVTENSLKAMTGVHSINAQGALDLTFAGVVDHVSSNTSPGGVISTTANKLCAIHFAIDKHPYGLVYVMEVTDYIDVDKVLKARNFKNRYEAQIEMIVPHQITTSQIKRVELYKKDPKASTEEWTGGKLIGSRTVIGGTLI